jgi:hypothetical protein
VRDQNSTKRHPYTLDELLEITVGNLYAAYKSVKRSEVPWQRFVEQVLGPVAKCDLGETDRPLDILQQYLSDEDRAKGPEFVSRSSIGPIALSATYFFRADRARKEGHTDHAWSYLADARYWCGVALSQKGVDAAFQLVQGDLSRSGGKGRAASFEPIKLYAFGLVKSEKPSGGWQSRSQAVKKIKDKVLAYAKTQGKSMSGDQAMKTIDGWLGSMPEKDQHFPKRKERA